MQPPRLPQLPQNAVAAAVAFAPVLDGRGNSVPLIGTPECRASAARRSCHARHLLRRDFSHCCSMKQRGQVTDTAMMETFFSTLRGECADGVFASRAEARLNIFEYVEIWYNRQRRHSSLGYQKPGGLRAGLHTALLRLHYRGVSPSSPCYHCWQVIRCQPFQSGIFAVEKPRTPVDTGWFAEAGLL